MKKYILTEETKQIGSTILRRIKALRSFGDVKEGDLGGFLEKEENLSQEGNCWVFGSANVFGDARVFEDASVSGSASVYGDANVYGSASVSGSASVFGYASVYGSASVFEDASVFGSASVFEDASVFGSASVYGDASVFGGARVFGDARVSGPARVFGSARVSESHFIQFGNTTTDLSKDLKSLIQNSCNLGVFDNKIFAYKMVIKKEDGSFVSEYDPNFVYEIGKIAEVKDPDLSNISCSSGIHVSGFHYWTHKTNKCNAYLLVEVNLDDVITCQEGKIRCKKVKVLGANV